ncbi:caspase family protein [Streptomyces sp. NBC_01485]|uniref:caspase family protein n=1 Tax=Streptomyces sp. NBC_01485 TaxID=2903884 RepID=UPI002E2F32F8|nr:caspase family protein [Streptomyces sp. NBC_01485]
MPDPWIPDGSASRAVLIGVPTYRSADLAEIPAVRDNLTALRKVLTGEHGLLPVGHCQVLGDQDQPLDKATLGSALAVARLEATDLLLVYYAGHGLLDEDGLLHLTLADAEPDNVAYTAVPLEVVKRELSRARARARVLVLDCCFSGRAVAAMSTPDSLVAGQLEVTGTFTLTSTTATAPSHAPLGATYTAFTEALLGALRTPGPLTLDEIYVYVDRDLAGRGLPRPQRRSVNAASDLVLVSGPVEERPVSQKATGPSQVRFTRRISPGKRRWYACLSAVWTLLACGLGYAMWLRPSAVAGGLIPELLLVALACGTAIAAREKPRSLMVDKTGLTLDRDGMSCHIPWQDIDYLGVLRQFTYTGSSAAPGSWRKTVSEVLVVRPRQTAPRPEKTSLLPANYQELQDFGYIGICKLRFVDADPVVLRQAVERLGGPLFRSHRDLVDMDPRLPT